MMSNPWEPINTTKSDVDWLNAPVESNPLVTCPQCGSQNCVEVWVDGGESSYLCCMCDCEFEVHGQEERGLIRDEPISSADSSTFASIWKNAQGWNVTLNVFDDVVYRGRFDEEYQAVEFVQNVKVIYNRIVLGTRVCLLNDSMCQDIVEILENGWCVASDGDAEYQVPIARFAAAIVIGKMYIKVAD